MISYKDIFINVIYNLLLLVLLFFSITYTASSSSKNYL